LIAGTPTGGLPSKTPKKKKKAPKKKTTKQNQKHQGKNKKKRKKKKKKWAFAAISIETPQTAKRSTRRRRPP